MGDILSNAKKILSSTETILSTTEDLLSVMEEILSNALTDKRLTESLSCLMETPQIMTEYLLILTETH